MNNHVNIMRFIPICPNPLHGLFEQQTTIGVLISRVRVGKKIPDIGQTSGSQQRVGDRVEHHVGIAVAGKPFGVFNDDPAQDQPPFFHQSVNVVTDADTNDIGHEKPPPLGALACANH